MERIFYVSLNFPEGHRVARINMLANQTVRIFREQIALEANRPINSFVILRGGNQVFNPPDFVPIGELGLAPADYFDVDFLRHPTGADGNGNNDGGPGGGRGGGRRGRRSRSDDTITRAIGGRIPRNRWPYRAGNANVDGAQQHGKLVSAEEDFRNVQELDRQITSYGVVPNPYTWFTMAALGETWRNLQKAQEIHAQRTELKKIEDLGALLEEHLILDNLYTENSTMGLAQAWDQLAMRMQHNLGQQQIQAQNQSGVSEEALREFFMMFRHFDREKQGRLDHQQQFKCCLRVLLGYDLPMVNKGQPKPEFQPILDIVDPNRAGYVTLQEFMAFLINKETEKMRPSAEIEMAFRALSKELRPYVIAEELHAKLTPEQAEYCIERVKSYVDAVSCRTIAEALDF